MNVGADALFDRETLEAARYIAKQGIVHGEIVFRENGQAPDQEGYRQLNHRWGLWISATVEVISNRSW